MDSESYAADATLSTGEYCQKTPFFSHVVISNDCLILDRTVHTSLFNFRQQCPFIKYCTIAECNVQLTAFNSVSSTHAHSFKLQVPFCQPMRQLLLDAMPHCEKDLSKTSQKMKVAGLGSACYSSTE